MRILFLTHRVPYAPNRGDRIRAYHILRELKAAGFSVCLVALAHDADEAAEASRLSGRVDEIQIVRVPRVRNLLAAAVALGSERPLTHVLLDAPEMPAVLERVLREFQPDVVLAYCSGMARFALNPPLETVPFVLDMVDVDSFKWDALADEQRGPLRWIYRRESRLLRRFEARAARAARTTMVVSERETEALRTLDAGVSAVVVPNGIDVPAFRHPGTQSTRAEVVFTGVFSYEPNETGALWLIEKVWPLVLRVRPDAHLTLVGSGPNTMLRRAASDAGVDVTGAVPDVRPYLWRASVAVAPLHTARGVQNKVIEAAAAALPSVVTPAVYEGLPDTVRRACVVGADAASFAAAIGTLLELSPAERRAKAYRAALEQLTWERALAPLRDILTAAVQHESTREEPRALAEAQA